MKKILISAITASVLTTLGMAKLSTPIDSATNLISTGAKNLTSVANLINQNANFAKGEVIILFKDNVKITKKILDIFKKFTYAQYNIVNGIWVKSSSMSTQELMKFFLNSPIAKYIANISPNYEYNLVKTTDSYYNKLWAIENVGQEVNGKSGTVDADMDVKEAWNKTTGSSSVVVAVLDTGVDYTHEDLSANMWRGNRYPGYDFAGDNDGNNDKDPMPDYPYDENGHYHGTHVAGIIGAVGDNGVGVSGVNQDVQIMALKVFRPNGYGYTNDILEALDYVAQKIDEGEKIVAINASYGGSGGSQDDAVNKAIKNLGKKGVVFVAAAGNDSKDIDKDPVYPAAYDASNIIAVAASDQDDKLASFSNYGKKNVDVAAPGTNILSTYPEDKYAYLQGTSMATPQVTGEVALITAYDPTLSVDEKIEIVKNSVDKKSSLSSIATSGRVNAYSALKMVDDLNNGGDDDDDTNPPANNPPVAKDDSATTEYETKVTIDVIKNDSDPDGDSLSLTKVSNPSHGEARIVNNKVEYTPDKGFSGNDSFTYEVSDGNGGVATATVYVEVKEKPNSKPVAKDDSATTEYETKVTIDVLKNDSDPDGDKLSIKSVSSPKHGSVRIVNNKIEYTPDNGFSGDDSFTYEVTDNKGGVDSAKVYVEVKEEEKDSGGGFFGGFFGGGSDDDDDDSGSGFGWFW